MTVHCRRLGFSPLLASGLLNFLACLIAAPGCVGTPQPDPPTIKIYEDQIERQPTSRNGEFLLIGHPGAVSFGRATIRFWDLDAETPVQTVTSEEDGSFQLLLASDDTHEFRIQAFTADETSPPVDFVFVGETAIEWVFRPLESCLTTSVDRILDVTAGVREEITIFNDCDVTVTIESVGLRAPTTLFTITGEPGELPSERTATVAVDYLPFSAESFAVLLIEISAPEIDRRPVTLRGVVP